MSELKHWLDEASDADEFERSILRAGLEADPPQLVQDQIWSNLMGAVLPVLAATAGVENVSAKAGTVGVGKASAVWLAVAKGFVVGLSVYGATAGVMEISNRLAAPPAPRASATRVVTKARFPSIVEERPTAPPAPALEPASDDAPSRTRATSRGNDNPSAPAATNRETALPSVVSFDDESESHASDARVSQLEGETRALRRARDELRAGKLADAFATLEASQRRFAAPELVQEREALMIELLARSGQQAAAAQRARAFLSRFPESPHAQQVRTLLR